MAIKKIQGKGQWVFLQVEYIFLHLKEALGMKANLVFLPNCFPHVLM
jgi:hypothetical protein